MLRNIAVSLLITCSSVVVSAQNRFPQILPRVYDLEKEPRPTPPGMPRIYDMITEARQVHPSIMTSKQIEEMIVSIFGREHARMALAVSRAENASRSCTIRSPRNSNGTYDWGVFQINDVHRNRFWMYDVTRCDENILVAYLIFKEQGWGPWVAYRNRTYYKFYEYYSEY